MQAGDTEKSRKGFTLIEIALIVGVVGLIIGTYLSFYQPNDQNKKVMITQQKIDRVLDAAASYLIDHNNLPPPASVIEGTINGINFGELNNGSITQRANYVDVGIVPYRTLGLSQEEAKDAFGNYLTYVVAESAQATFGSPVRLNPNPGDPSTEVFNTCYENPNCTSGFDAYRVRTGVNSPSSERFPTEDNATFSPLPGVALGTRMLAYSPVKAADDMRSNFCYNGDTTYYGYRNAAFLPNSTTFPGITIQRNGAVETRRAMIAIISHGMDGYGAFVMRRTAPVGEMIGSTTLNNTLLSMMGAEEINNNAATVSATIQVAPYSPEPGASHFDDQIGYLTGPDLISRTGSTTCHEYYPVCDCRKKAEQFRAEVGTAPPQCTMAAYNYDLILKDRDDNWCNPNNDFSECNCCYRDRNAFPYATPTGLNCG